MFYLSLFLAKLTNFFIKVFRFGAGYTWPGHVALKVFPFIAGSRYFNYPKGIVLISGTNGKTTTSKLVTHVLQENGFAVTNNSTGANLLNGIISSVLLDMNVFGEHRSDIGVFEVDEYVLPHVLEFIKPKVVALLNLSRDQLDRYGEVDSILEKWTLALEKIDSSVNVVLWKEQKRFKNLSKKLGRDVYYFDSSKDKVKNTSLVGEFNARNVNAAISICRLIGLGDKDIIRSLILFKSAYGRGESVELGDQIYRILLAKNPASFNNNLSSMAKSDVDPEVLFFILNDNIPDGRDVSWIYDIHPKLLYDVCKERHIYVSGARCLDMAVRLMYAGVDILEENVDSSVKKIISLIKNNKCRNVMVLPNYSAMLNLRKILVGRKIL